LVEGNGVDRNIAMLSQEAAQAITLLDANCQEFEIMKLYNIRVEKLWELG